MDSHHLSIAIDFMASDTAKPFVIPITGLVLGVVLMSAAKAADVGRLVLFFGVQSFMNIYMAWVFRMHVTVAKGFELPGGERLERDLHGCPVGFALTAMQQIISFLCFALLYGCLYFTKYKIEPKKVGSVKEAVSICMFGCVFALNVALNNLSLGYINIAVNLIIRSCLPLTTLLCQQLVAAFGLYPFKVCNPLELSLMAIGVLCALAFTLAKIMGSASGGQSSNMVLGVLMCLASLLCGSLNLSLAGVLGEMKMSVFDTVAYMSVPATLFLLPFAMFLQKPVPGEWPEVFGMDGMEQVSDWQILRKVYVIAPSTFALFALSGVFSFAYNIVQFKLVQTLSPSATAFGGNFNKAALVFLTLAFPALQVHELPGPPYIFVIWIAVVGNVIAFSVYSYLQIRGKEEKRKEEKEQEEKKQDLLEKKALTEEDKVAGA